jgi:hypothetical protein
LVDPDFTDLITTLPHDQQYSYVENGSAQVLDHVVVSGSLLSRLTRFAIARNDADFPEAFRNDPNRSERVSDHDMPVVYFSLPEATPPVLHLPADITVEAAGPSGTVVTFTATATDAVDANVVVTCAPASGSLFPLGATMVSCSATNSRNKTATGSFNVKVVDTTAPLVSVLGVTNGATYLLGSVPAASCSTTDSASGVAVPASLSITGGTSNGVGHFTATCSGAVDNAGNSAPPVSASYNVQYVFSGFLAPLSPDPANGGTFHAGRTIPLKWQLENTQGGNIVTASAIAAVQIALDASCAPGDQGAVSDADAPGNSGLQVSPTGFQFNWQTKGLPVGCYVVILTLDDGSKRTSLVQLR